MLRTQRWWLLFLAISITGPSCRGELKNAEMGTGTDTETTGTGTESTTAATSTTSTGTTAGGTSTGTTTSTGSGGAICGNGIAEGDEECDDGDLDDNDECLTSCKNAVCGDAVVHQGVEDCDDGNSLESDDCIACKSATCGDGFVWDGAEACDDGNLVPNDGCTETCTIEPFCQPFKFTDPQAMCPTGATKWCTTVQIDCFAEQSTFASVACEVCMGEPCDVGGSKGSCDNPSLHAPGTGCPGDFTFLLVGGFCQWGEINDCGSPVGRWCE